LIGATALAFVAVAIGVGFDFAHSNDYCAPTTCNWTSRAGAVVIVCGTYLAFRAAAVLITFNQEILRTNPRASLWYGYMSFALIAGGTLLWAFGDLIRF
jgi:hypothetical protein